MELGSIGPLVPTAASLAVYLLLLAGFLVGMWRGVRALVQPKGTAATGPNPANTPFVSILKPLAGADDELIENLDTFATLEYPAFELLFGVTSSDDPAYSVARRFIAAHPSVRARVVITDPAASVNPKVAQLIGLEKVAQGALLVISDSNIRVRPSYLAPIVRELSDPKVGVVSSVVVGTGERSVGAALENLQLGTMVAPGVVAAATVAGKVMTVGKSMAMRRENLRTLGGFAGVGGVLAEDHVLGMSCAARGLEVRLSKVPVENRNVDCSIGRTVERHTRWAKMRRSLHPVGFAMEPLLSPLLVATLSLFIWPTAALAKATLLALLAQVVGAFVTMRVLRGRFPSPRFALLEVLRSYLVFFCWARAWFSRRVGWRGHEFSLAAGSRILPAEPTTWRRVRALVGVSS